MNKYRFDDDLIGELVKADFGKLTSAMIKEYIGELYDNLERKDQLEWMLKSKADR